MRILVTGAAGFVGRNFVPMRYYFANKETKIFSTDIVADPPENLDGSDYVSLDLTDVKGTQKLIKDIQPNFIVHLAGNAKVSEGGKNNIEMFANVLRGCRPFPHTHVILAGSAVEYGDQENRKMLPKEEDWHIPIKVDVPDDYACSKISCGNLLKTETGTLGTILRFANLYGPGQKSRLIPDIIKSVIEGNLVTLTGQGEPIRQFVYVDDACRAIWLTITQNCTGVFNIGGPEYSLFDIYKVVNTAISDFQLRKNQIPKYAEFFYYFTKLSGPMRIAMDNTKALNVLGWAPQISIYDGIRRVVASEFLRLK